MGLGFLLQTVYLLPLTALFLAVAVGSLAFRAKKRRGYRPFVVGIVAAIVLVVGKFIFDSDMAVYGAIIALIGSSLWNSWPKKSVPFAPTETLLQLGSIKKES